MAFYFPVYILVARNSKNSHLNFEKNKFCMILQFGGRFLGAFDEKSCPELLGVINNKTIPPSKFHQNLMGG